MIKHKRIQMQGDRVMVTGGDGFMGSNPGEVLPIFSSQNIENMHVESLKSCASCEGTSIVIDRRGVVYLAQEIKNNDHNARKRLGVNKSKRWQNGDFLRQLSFL